MLPSLSEGGRSDTARGHRVRLPRQASYLSSPLQLVFFNNLICTNELQDRDESHTTSVAMSLLSSFEPCDSDTRHHDLKTAPIHDRQELEEALRRDEDEPRGCNKGHKEPELVVDRGDAKTAVTSPLLALPGGKLQQF